MRYDRSALMSGELWRVLTAHLVHLNSAHLLLNLLGLCLICELQWGDLPPLHGVRLLGFAGVAISALLWWGHPELAWYAGLSGALHGLWAGCVFLGLWPPASFPQKHFPASAEFASFGDRRLYLGGAILLAIKLAVEFYYGPSANTAHTIGGEVVVVSHLYGALAGIGYAMILRIPQSLRPTK